MKTSDALGMIWLMVAGVLAGMEWAAANRPDLSWVASFATDMPFFPTDLVARLFAAIEAKNAGVAFARSADEMHPVFALRPMRLADVIRHELASTEPLAPTPLRAAFVTFPPGPPPPFFNVNRPEDLERAEQLLSGRVDVGPIE